MCTSGVMGAEYKLHIMQQAANISLQRNPGSFYLGSLQKQKGQFNPCVMVTGVTASQDVCTLSSIPGVHKHAINNALSSTALHDTLMISFPTVEFADIELIFCACVRLQ